MIFLCPKSIYVSWGCYVLDPLGCLEKIIISGVKPGLTPVPFGLGFKIDLLEGLVLSSSFSELVQVILSGPSLSLVFHGAEMLSFYPFLALLFEVIETFVLFSWEL